MLSVPGAGCGRSEAKVSERLLCSLCTLCSTVTLYTCTGAMAATAASACQCGSSGPGSCSRASVSLTATSCTAPVGVYCVHTHSIRKHSATCANEAPTLSQCLQHCRALAVIRAEHAHQTVAVLQVLSPVCAVTPVDRPRHVAAAQGVAASSPAVTSSQTRQTKRLAAPRVC